MFDNNGLTVYDIKEMKQGDSFIYIKQQKQWSEPRTFVVAENRGVDLTTDYDTNELEDATLLVDQNGNELIISHALAIPMCQGYDIFKDLSYFIKDMFTKAEQKQKVVDDCMLFLDGFQDFSKEMIEKFPEKII